MSSRCEQDCYSFEGSRGESFLAYLLGFGGCQPSLAFLGLQLHHPSLYLHLFLCVSLPPLRTMPHHWI